MRFAHLNIGAVALSAGSARADDPTAEARGSQTGAKVQAEFERAHSSAWRFGAMGSYANQQNSIGDERA